MKSKGADEPGPVFDLAEFEQVLLKLLQDCLQLFSEGRNTVF